eukprot:TRINITY_DN7600_c0_g1_i5.p1 TRINITY_DN7600_c0_g1~~TRINITY_DN7600_c0_g1_i5.p1  ORF type:complete len:235 (-),score=21.39 TRINITY_DN7600_c0_g1_i5:64-666(-)
MRTFLLQSLFCLMVVAGSQAKSDKDSSNSHVAENMSNFLPKFIQSLACQREETDLNSRALLQAEHVVQVAVNTVLTSGELRGWEYVIDYDGERVLIPSFLLNTTLKGLPYFKISLFDEDDSQNDDGQFEQNQNSGETLTVHELASDFVATVTTAISGAFQELDEQVNFSVSKECLENIVADVKLWMMAFLVKAKKNGTES